MQIVDFANWLLNNEQPFFFQNQFVMPKRGIQKRSSINAFSIR